MKVSDQAIELYGLETAEEREFFELLMNVSGVGPKAAMKVLSLGTLSEIQSAIARGDVKYLTAVQGMGTKTAERLVVELKSKVQSPKFKVGDSGASETIAEVIEALVGLGYTRDEARSIVTQIDTTDKSTEELLKLALQHKK